jgi:hypothetical protein
MLYLLDANVLITANSQYYPIDQVPEFWGWMHYQPESGNVKIPLEVMEEIKAGRKDGDLLLEWILQDAVYDALLFQEAVDAALVQRILATGYAPDLTDVEVEKIGRDPFLIAYALAHPADRCVITNEVSKPSTQRQHRKIPDVCRAFDVRCFGPFVLNRNLGFHTGWKAARD